MSYDLCGKEWEVGEGMVRKVHHCVEMAGHFMHCVCKCGARKLLREVPLKRWEPKPRQGRRGRSAVIE